MNSIIGCLIKLMNKKISIFFIITILLYSYNVFSEDISDFQIEDISIGDSAYDYFSNNELKNAYEIYNYKNNEFRYYFLPYRNSKTYEYLQITVKPSDQNFIIYGLQGHIIFNDIKECHKKMDSIINELDNLFDTENYEDKGSHYIDPSGDSTYFRKSYFLNNNDRVDVVCFDMSKAFEEEGKSDRLAVTLDKREFINFIDKNYK